MTADGKTAGVVHLKRKPAEPVKLTTARVGKLQPRESRYEVRDAQTPGLIVRVQPSGAKSYYVKSRIGTGRAAPFRNIRIGSVDAVTLQKARAEALRMIADMRRGIDPTDQTDAVSLSQLVDAYADHRARRGVVKHKDEASSLRRNLNRYMRRPARDLTRAHITGLMDVIEAGGQQSDYFRKCVSGLLTWAENNGHLPVNVMAGYRRPKDTRAEKLNVRDKVTFITPEEIRAFWVATEQIPNHTHRDLLQFMLLTGQRRSETAWMTRKDVDGDVWTIPASLHKMGEAVRVPLGPVSQRILAAQPQHAGVGLVFPGRYGKRIGGFSQLLRPVKEALNNPGFGFHALRRTYRTGLEELGVPERVAELMIGHKRDDLMQRYSKAELWTLRVEAQAQWEAHIARVVS